MYTVYLAHANLHKIPEICAEKMQIILTHPSSLFTYTRCVPKPLAPMPVPGV